MNKHKVTEMDFNTAFKVLGDIDTPRTKGLKASNVELEEGFRYTRRGKNGLDRLIEDFYDLNSAEETEEAIEDRANDIAKAKLARIEKIVDLDAKSASDLLDSYEGKYIIRCPQCLTSLFKNKEDIVVQEGEELEIGTTVNVGERCQACGNEDGYELEGKVAGFTPEDQNEAAEQPAEEQPAEEAEMPEEEAPTEELPKVETEEEADSEEALPETEEAEKEEPKKESLREEKDLAEDIDIKNALDAQEVKNRLNNIKFEDLESENKEEPLEEDVVSNKEFGEWIQAAKDFKESLTEADDISTGTEEAAKAAGEKISANIEQVTQKLNDILETEQETEQAEDETEDFLDEIEEFDESLFSNLVSKYLRETYSNVDTFTTSNCRAGDNKLCVEGLISFKSGKTKNITFTLSPAKKQGIFEGMCPELTGNYNKAFAIKTTQNNKTLQTEAFKYKYKVGKNLVEGLIKK